MSASERFGALQERDFRLLFTGTMITTVGDRLAGIALAFAVLDIGSATGARHRLRGSAGRRRRSWSSAAASSPTACPRNLVLAGASLVQGVAQAATAAFVLGGMRRRRRRSSRSRPSYGVGLGLVLPAEVGLVPQTVSPERLQQANALQGLTPEPRRRARAGVGGAIVVAASPGIALAVDAVSFFVCAELLRRIRVAPRADADVSTAFFAELREGWREFTSRTWLWASVILFGIGNLALAGWLVLGPVIAKAISAAPVRGRDPHRRRYRRHRRERDRDADPARSGRSSRASSRPCPSRSSRSLSRSSPRCG